MTDLKIADGKNESLESAKRLSAAEELLTEWTFLSAWGTPEAASAFKRCRSDLARVLGVDLW